MKKINETKDSKALIEVKKDIWSRVKNWFKNLISPNKKEIIEQTVEQSASIEINNKEIENFSNEVVENQIENDYVLAKAEENNIKNSIIQNAKNAYENYVLNDEYEISQNLYNLIKERINANQDSIERLIQINNEKITFNKIIEILNDEEINLQNYKKTIESKKIDDKFLFSQYMVPVGIIGIACNDSIKAIENIFKSITTRNAIIVIEENYNQYSVENLILLIAQEVLNKFNIDENIIQIVKKEDLTDTDIKEFDVMITKNNNVIEKECTTDMYIYQEDEYFSDIVKEEVDKLNLQGKKVQIIKGNLNDCIEKINQKRNYGVSIYSQNLKTGYKFVNLVKSDNVFVNGTLLNSKTVKQLKDVYFNCKNLISEYRLG